MRELAGKRVLITGAARGIGLELGRRFSAERAELLLADRDVEALPEAAEVVRAAGGNAWTLQLDVTDPRSVARARERVHAERGPIDVLVNNAGIVHGGAFLDVAEELHERTLEVNALGSVRVARAFLPDLISRPVGHLVQIASAAGFVGLPFGATYAASKWAAIGFAESIRLELRELGHRHVGVTCVCPGFVGTGLFAGARPPRTTAMLSPARVADLTVRAVRRNRPFVLAPWLIRVTPVLKGILPTRWFDRLARLTGFTSSMEGWRGRGSV